MEHLYERLKRYGQGDDYPLHMPGHKRHAFGEMPPACHAMDITEIDGFDDLHAPEGIIKDLQERIARLYGAEESFCLVNGSTAGILSAISAAVLEGGKLLMARNCHKSAYHAAYLRDLQVTYLFPRMVEGISICDGIEPEQVRQALQEDPEIRAVMIVSPTYEGRISPVREIAKVVHEFGKILIVDEAHGAHLGLVPTDPKMPCPENGCQAGADLVIHSVHKTLPAMTQTALLHVNGDRVDRERLRRFLRIYQSSSPSYVLMASIDNAVTLMEEKGKLLYKQLFDEFSKLTEALSACRHFWFLAAQDPLHQDVGKLVICAGSSGMTGQQIYDKLREKYHLQLEMAAGTYCLAMFTVGDTPEGFKRLQDALLSMDREASEQGMAQTEDASLPGGTAESRASAETVQEARIAMSLRKAWDAPWEEVALSECEGRIAAEFVNLYPPGTPLMAPGEIFSKDLAEALKTYRKQGLRLRGVSDAGEGTVRCVKEQE